MSKVNIRYCMRRADDCGISWHPQRVMRELGISWANATPQPIADQWWFWLCEGVPDPMPSYLTVLTVKPSEAVGHGLSFEEARALESRT